MSMGRGKMMVEFFSAAMELSVCRYLSWRADGASEITRAASFRALEAFISPSAAMIWNTDARASVLLPALFVFYNSKVRRGKLKLKILRRPVFTFALASRVASASAAMALCSCWGNFTSLISTRSTLMPHRSVASSRDSCRGRFKFVVSSVEPCGRSLGSIWFRAAFVLRRQEISDKPRVPTHLTKN